MPDEPQPEEERDHFTVLEEGLATAAFPIFHAVGSPMQVTAWSGDPLSGITVGDHLFISPGADPPGIDVHTSLRIDGVTEERCALVVVPIYPLREDDPPDADPPLSELWDRVADATQTQAATLAIDGVDELWTLVEAEREGAWAATRHHDQLTITIAGRGLKFGETQLERVRDPLGLTRSQRPDTGDSVIVMESADTEISTD